MRKWQCTVCGYIHEGDEPPEECPVCGADRSKFIEIVSEEPVETQTDQPESEDKNMDSKPESPIFRPKLNPIYDLMLKHHVHPISVHIPNGVLPASVIFIVLAALFNFSGLSQAAFYNLIFVVLTLPLVLFSGYIEWQKKYKGQLTRLFKTKILCAAVVSLTAVILMVWLFIDPQASTSSSNLLFLLINFVMLAAAGIAGFIGGKFVFKN
ncbi:MAG: rubredoxin [Deltaproteobacteria bacterium]|nr:rubredoxin [Deltaproteobacteria bacterium]